MNQIFDRRVPRYRTMIQYLGRTASTNIITNMLLPDVNHLKLVRIQELLLGALDVKERMEKTTEALKTYIERRDELPSMCVS